MYHEVMLENDRKGYYYHLRSSKAHKHKSPTSLIERDGTIYSENDIREIQNISGIFNNIEDKKSYIEGLMPGSFALWCKFKLESPYFSSADDELNKIQNPILKEQISKVPMLRAGSWKGVLSSVALSKIKSEAEKGNVNGVISNYLSFARIFGTGSQNFRKVKDEIKIIIKENEQKDSTKLADELFRYSIFDLGINISIKKDGTSIGEQILEQINESLEKTNYIFSAQKGRAIFYPTYFDRLNYEIINPHDRDKRIGKNPIIYEVVPKTTEGIFQLIYIPYDGVLTKEEKLKEEINCDREFIKDILKESLENVGIGAKTKLGWGRAKIEKRDIKCLESSWREVT